MPWKNGNPPLYHVWRNMLDRCNREESKQYADYGGRGIVVCKEWRESYQQWFNDMGPRPLGHTLERKDNNKGYNKENCKWATRKEQQRNQRVTRKVVIGGVTYVAANLAEQAGVKTDVIVERVNRGLDLKQVLSKERFFNLEGLKKGAAVSAKRRRRRTCCKNGHRFTPENTRMEGNGKYTWRVCRACHRERHRK